MERTNSSIFKKIFYSDYKSQQTIKFLVAIDACGRVVFVSDGFGGRISDKAITKQCAEELFGWLWRGAEVMVDKGFLINETAEKYGFRVRIPSRIMSNSRYNFLDIGKNKQIARSRIHVERAIRNAKGFKILTDRLPVSMVNNISDIAQVCFYLTNYMGELVLGAPDEDNVTE
jgi:hypothetical protein